MRRPVAPRRRAILCNWLQSSASNACSGAQHNNLHGPDWTCAAGDASTFEPLDLSTDLGGVHAENIGRFAGSGVAVCAGEDGIHTPGVYPNAAGDSGWGFIGGWNPAGQCDAAGACAGLGRRRMSKYPGGPGAGRLAGLDDTALEAWKKRKQEARGEPLPIVRVDQPEHAILRQKARPVRHANRRLRELIARMWATMYAHDGVGLAAPQVGVGLRVCVADSGERCCALINPEIVAASGSQIEPLEGCLSIPDLSGEVERAQTVRVRGLDPDGREVWVDAEGYFARVLQHEIDHLDGILFTDRARRLVRPSPETKLRVVYLGTSAFGAEVLRVCLDGGVVPALVVTQPDRPAGRGLRARPTPVRTAAEQAGVEVVTPDRARDPELAARIGALSPDVLVTAAYGQIVPESLLRLPRLGAVNVHPSRLPLYRGPDPIRRALWNGDRETAVTILRMSREVDAGDILVQEPVEIGSDEDGGALSARLAAFGGELLLRALRQLAKGTAEARPQEHARATYAPKIAPEEEVADFGLPAEVLACRVRALAPRPGLRTPGGLKLLRARALALETPGAAPGTVTALAPGEGLAVATARGVLLLREVQPAGGRPMDALAYANGRRLKPGQPLE